MKKLFGTDGIRGKANCYPVTCEIAMRTGKAIAHFAKTSGYKSIVIGKDTRLSGDMLESSLAAGAASAGVDVCLVGVMPSPGVAFVCKNRKGVGAGIVISASHNPFKDNGIKIFKKDGMKLDDDQEAIIESLIINPAALMEQVSSDKIGRIAPLPNALEQYVKFLLSKVSFDNPDCFQNRPIKLVIDTSNGAASKIGHKVFSKPYFDPVFIHDRPDGYNINFHCGSEDTGDLSNKVIELKADIGIAFDGDADRMIAVDENGERLTGDQILAICATHALHKGELRNKIVVSTIMSNIGLSKALRKVGIKHVQSDVGDRKLIEKMHSIGALIGGENSGHLVFMNHHSTCDGLLSALKLLEIIATTGKPLSLLSRVMIVYPQILRNVEVDDSKPNFMKNSVIAPTIEQVKQKLADKGRVLIRYSGTQPLLRIMLEGPDPKLLHEYCNEICLAIRKNLR